MLGEPSARVVRRRNKPRYAQTAIIRRFCRKLRVISLPFQIFRRLNALFTALCVQNVVHAFSIVETSPYTLKIAIIRRFCSKIKRYFSPVRDISTFKRILHCVMLAEPSARVFRRRNKPRYTQIAIIRRFCRKFSDISTAFVILRRLNALFTALYVQSVVHACPPMLIQAQIYANCNNSSIL